MKYHLSLILVLIHLSFLNAQVDREAAIHFNEGVLAFKANNYEGAVEAYTKAINVDAKYNENLKPLYIKIVRQIINLYLCNETQLVRKQVAILC